MLDFDSHSEIVKCEFTIMHGWRSRYNVHVDSPNCSIPSIYVAVGKYNSHITDDRADQHSIGPLIEILVQCCPKITSFVSADVFLTCVNWTMWTG